jgi:zinc D-Ala-D-Ala dipeptidase
LFLAEEYLRQLNPQVTFKVTDALRPIELQRQYFEKIRDEFQHKEGLQGEALYDRVTQVIADPDLCPPHTTGGAIDLTLIDISSQQELDMGTKIDELEDERIYMFHPNLSTSTKKNRILLYTVLSEAGFIDWPGEWWHYSYGDQQWALVTGQAYAIYDKYQPAVTD